MSTDIGHKPKLPCFLLAAPHLPYRAVKKHSKTDSSLDSKQATSESAGHTTRGIALPAWQQKALSLGMATAAA